MNYPQLSQKTSTNTLAVRNQGFALVIALGLMAFVLLLLLAITTMVQVESHSASVNKSRLEAEQSALLAMQMAIGELQSFTGLDTRVTASSTLLNENNVPVTGVWRSWEGSDRDQLNYGKPIVPNYAAKRAVGDLDAANPTVGLDASATSGRFLGWLTSAELPDDPDDAIPANLISNTASSGLVPMVTNGSVANDSEKVYIAPTLLGGQSGTSGSIAWWVSGDNAKAMINDDSSEAPTTVQDWQQRVRSNGWADPAAFGFGKDTIFSNKELPSTGSLAMVADSSAELRRFHDLTTFNRGLLTNTAAGGWRRDLSLMTESYDGETSDGDAANYNTASPLPSGARASRTGFSFYTPKPGEIGFARKADGVTLTPGALLYPWASYRSGLTDECWGHTGPICSWTALADYAMQYTLLENYSATNTRFKEYAGEENWGSWNNKSNKMHWADKIRVAPIISRVHWVFSLASVETRSGRNTKYTPKLLLTPAVTVWNPYNVELAIPSNFYFRLGWTGKEITPFKFKFRINGQPTYEIVSDSSQKYKEGTSFADLAIGGATLKFPSGDIILPPGASRLFSVTNTQPEEETTELQLQEGYAIGGGFLYGIKDFSSGGSFTTDADGFITDVDEGAEFAVEAVNISPALNSDEIGVNANILAGNGNDRRRFPLRNRFDVNDLAGGGMSGAEVIQDIYPPLEDGGGDLAQGAIEGFKINLGGFSAQPFAAAILASRASAPLASSDEPSFSHLDSKGLLQSNPLCYYIEMRTDAQEAHGSHHPINSSYAFSFRSVLGWNDTAYGWIPQTGPSGVSSYVVSGIAPANGLTRCIMAELPTRPIQSLADLQHWDARNNNSVPPFQFNLIANASATPLIPSGEVSVLGPRPFNQSMSNDDSYLLNHVLFDDWFVSSIAPDFGDFGTSAKRSIKEVYEQHLDRTEPLPNRFYLPAEGADLPSASSAATQIMSGGKDTVTDKYAYETVASDLQVAGMFNVNSTSLDAWRALLRQSRDSEVPYLDENGQIELDVPSSYSYPRTSIASDRGTDSGSTESGTAIQAAEFAGHRVLTEKQIDRLAEYIVAAIRERGPFLSLSEFVNRQLIPSASGSDADLALAGTIQSALDRLADLGAVDENPYRELQANSVNITSLPSGNHEYQFEEAAYGYSAFGMPGWVRQADILRPLAPIISARDDTFTIRSYGDVRDPTDPDKVIARIWCEAVVVRTADFVDPVDDATVLPHSSEMTSVSNQRFGRKYKIASFRWLNEDEI